jgi:hypothetical protein
MNWPGGIPLLFEGWLRPNGNLFTRSLARTNVPKAVPLKVRHARLLRLWRHR